MSTGSDPPLPPENLMSASSASSSGNDCQPVDDIKRNTSTNQQTESQRHTEETVRKLQSVLNELKAQNIELEGGNGYVQLGHAIVTAIHEHPTINAFVSKITNELSSPTNLPALTNGPVSQSITSSAPGPTSLQAGSSNVFNPAYKAFHGKPTPSFIDNARTDPRHMKIDNNYIVWYNPELKRDLDIRLLHQFNLLRKVDCVGLSKDGNVIAIGCTSSTYLYDMNSFSRVATLTVDDDCHRTEGSGCINSLCFSPDGNYLAIAKQMNIYIFDLNTSRVQKTLRLSTGEVVSLDYFPDGCKLLSGSKDGFVVVWTLETSDFLMNYHEKSVNTVAVSQDGDFYAVGFGDNTVGVWDADSELKAQFSGAKQFNRHRKQVLSVKFADDSGKVLSSSADATAKLWNFTNINQLSSSCEVTYEGHGDSVNSICLMPNIGCVISGSQDGKVICWNKTTGHPRLMLQAQDKPVTSVVAFVKPGSSRGILVSSSNEDFNVRVWEVYAEPTSAPISKPGDVLRCMTEELVKQASSNRTAHRPTRPRAAVKPAQPAQSSRAFNISSRFKIAKTPVQPASSYLNAYISTPISYAENLARFERIDWTLFPIQADHVLPAGTRPNVQAGFWLKKLCKRRLGVQPRYHFEYKQNQIKATITLKGHDLSTASASSKCDAEHLAAMAITEYPAARETLFD
ncbi:hypothetical protein DIURU_004100 [Diutina rugosa]|uniref:DRBM domain-containing protein n=1 Tax=Diutina rugosa TaxID=5481 RepID=A0A642UIU3_DIURU|nr:uncharacterized protein DIURU_004100 [Diutina rugosa]KAA8899843.1 hypothetical protein DIURU_004100 [Diutina rugosa]